MTKNIIAYFNYMNDYKIFRNGFEQIFTGKNSVTIGFKSNGEFRRTVFVGVYAAFSFIENGIYEIRGDTIITTTKSIDSYTQLDNDLIDREEYYIKNSNTADYLTDKSKFIYKLVRFRELEQIYNEEY